MKNGNQAKLYDQAGGSARELSSQQLRPNRNDDTPMGIGRGHQKGYSGGGQWAMLHFGHDTSPREASVVQRMRTNACFGSPSTKVENFPHNELECSR